MKYLSYWPTPSSNKSLSPKHILCACCTDKFYTNKRILVFYKMTVCQVYNYWATSQPYSWEGTLVLSSGVKKQKWTTWWKRAVQNDLALSDLCEQPVWSPGDNSWQWQPQDCMVQSPGKQPSTAPDSWHHWETCPHSLLNTPVTSKEIQEKFNFLDRLHWSLNNYLSGTNHISWVFVKIRATIVWEKSNGYWPL